MYFTDDGRVQISDGARRALERAGKAIASVTQPYTRDALPERGKPDPDYGAEIQELKATQDAHARAIALLGRSMPVRDVGASSTVGGRTSKYDIETDAEPDMDYSPANEREKVQQKLAYQNKLNDGPNSRVSDADVDIPRRPPSPSDINEANAKAWRRDKKSMTGGSGSLSPNSREAEGGSYMPNSAGTINEEARTSRTAPTLNRGQTWGTKDMRMMQVACATQDARTVSTIQRINAANLVRYRNDRR